MQKKRIWFPTLFVCLFVYGFTLIIYCAISADNLPVINNFSASDDYLSSELKDNLPQTQYLRSIVTEKVRLAGRRTPGLQIRFPLFELICRYFLPWRLNQESVADDIPYTLFIRFNISISQTQKKSCGRKNLIKYDPSIYFGKINCLCGKVVE